MNICIQKYTEMKNTDRDWNNVVLSLRLKDAEATRFWTLMDIGKNRNPYIDRTNIIRELFGLDDPKILTLDEIKYFQTGEKTSANKLRSNPGTQATGELDKKKVKKEKAA